MIMNKDELYKAIETAIICWDLDSNKTTRQ